MTPLYNDFFLSELIDDGTRSELQSLVIEQLAMITKVLINEDRIEKVLPIVMELLKDDTDEDDDDSCDVVICKKDDKRKKITISLQRLVDNYATNVDPTMVTCCNRSNRSSARNPHARPQML